MPVPTFAAIAHRVPADVNQAWVIADALQGQVYLQRFTRHANGGAMVPADELRIERAEVWLNWAAADVWVTGPGVKLYADRIPASSPVVPEADRVPSIESLFRVGLVVPPATREEMFALEPLYLRGSSAEEKAKG